MGAKFPYTCKVISSGLQFTPVTIDYDNRTVYRQIGQSSGSGEWYDFDELIFEKNKDFIELDLMGQRKSKLNQLNNIS